MRGLLGGKLHPHILLELCIFTLRRPLVVGHVCLPGSKGSITGTGERLLCVRRTPHGPAGFVPAPPPKQHPFPKQRVSLDARTVPADIFCLGFGFSPPLLRGLSPGRGAAASGRPCFSRTETPDPEATRPRAGGETQAESLGVPLLQPKEKINAVFIPVFCFGVLDD